MWELPVNMLAAQPSTFVEDCFCADSKTSTGEALHKPGNQAACFLDCPFHMFPFMLDAINKLFFLTVVGLF